MILELKSVRKLVLVRNCTMVLHKPWIVTEIWNILFYLNHPWGLLELFHLEIPRDKQSMEIKNCSQVS